MINRFRCITLAAILCVTSSMAAADVFYDTYQRGLAAFKAKDYPDARLEFLRAYDLRPEPTILFNIAQTYRLELQSEQALVYYKHFLEESEISEDLRRAAQAYVAGLEAEQAARDSQAKIDADNGPKERDGAPVRMPAPPMNRPVVLSSPIHLSDTANDSVNAGVSGPISEVPESGSLSGRKSHLSQVVRSPVLDRVGASTQTSRKVVPISVGAGAVALLGGGVGVELWAQSKYAMAKSEVVSQSRRESLYNSANTMHHVAQVLTVSGFAAGGAAVWLYLHDDSREPGTTNIANTHIVPTAGGFAIAGGF